MPCQAKSDQSAEVYTHIHTRKTHCSSLTDCPRGQLTAHRWKGEVWPGTLRPRVDHLRMPGEGQVQLQPTTLPSQPSGPTHWHTHKHTTKSFYSLLFRVTITTKLFSSHSLSLFLTKYDQTTLATSQLSVLYTDGLFYWNVQVRMASYCYSPWNVKFIPNYKSKQWWAEFCKFKTSQPRFIKSIVSAKLYISSNSVSGESSLSCQVYKLDLLLKYLHTIKVYKFAAVALPQCLWKHFRLLHTAP